MNYSVLRKETSTGTTLCTAYPNMNFCWQWTRALGPGCEKPSEPITCGITSVFCSYKRGNSSEVWV